jgi:glycosyltransferase involved in cell wall biosynthesis
MQALEATGFRLTVASLAVPDNCFLLQRPASLKAEILYPPPEALSEMLLTSPPVDESWRAMSLLAMEHVRKYAPAVLARGLDCTAWLCARELRRRGVQHVHVRSPAALPVALYLKKAGLPFSFTVESLPEGGESGEDELLRELMQEAEFIIAVGEATGNSLAGKAPDSVSKIHRIHQGIDASRYQAALCGDAGTLRIVSTSVLNPDRGLSLLMESMAKLGEAGIDAELCVAGDEPLRAAFEREAARLSLGNRVRYGHALEHEEVKRLLAASDVFVHPDPASGTALPPCIMEAMATGLPVIAVSQPGVEELISDEVTGWLVPPEAGALVERLAILANDPSLRADAGHAGLERVQEVFSLERTARPLAAQFRKSIAGRFAPSVVPQVAGVLCLLESWPFEHSDVLLGDELRFLRGQAGVDLLAARAESGSIKMPPENMEFLPDAAVLESVWHQERDLSSRAAALRSVCAQTPGEEFFRAARRAVYLAALRRSRGWAHVHALRASTALWAWLLQRLTGITASVVITQFHECRPEALAELVSGFAFGSLSDSRVTGDLPDLFRTAPPAGPRRFFGLLAAQTAKVPEVDPVATWTRWLAQVREAGVRAKS